MFEQNHTISRDMVNPAKIYPQVARRLYIEAIPIFEGLWDFGCTRLLLKVLTFQQSHILYFSAIPNIKYVYIYIRSGYICFSNPKLPHPSSICSETLQRCGSGRETFDKASRGPECLLGTLMTANRQSEMEQTELMLAKQQ